MNRSTVEKLLRQIENLPLEALSKCPELERLVPTLYELLQIDDECDHKFVNGICICGAEINRYRRETCQYNDSTLFLN